jgi:hypothetical protein
MCYAEEKAKQCALIAVDEIIINVVKKMEYDGIPMTIGKKLNKK